MIDDLFPDMKKTIPTPPPVKQKTLNGERYHRAMHRRFGIREGSVCGDCAHLKGVRLGKTYFKCERSVVTSGPGTDWRKKWTACGLFEVRK